MPAYIEAYVFRIECSDPAYFWSGVGDIELPPDAIVPTRDTYMGGGELLTGLPDLQQLINGTADSIEFNASGVDQESVRLALQDRDKIDGSIVRIGTIPLDNQYQIAGPVDWEWEGEARIVTIDRTADESDSVIRSISLTVESQDAARSRNQLSLFTNQDQRKRSTDDAFFIHVSGITSMARRRFGSS